MAKHSADHGLWVEVRVNGKARQKYHNDEDPQEKTVTKYVEARSGDHFEVLVRFLGRVTSVQSGSPR